MKKPLKLLEIMVAVDLATKKVLSYDELITLGSYEERLKYLQLYSNNPSNENRALMGSFYKSHAWRNVRDAVIRRDLGCDIGVPNLYIVDESMIVHHINPITMYDVETGSKMLLDPNNLITVSASTHNAIHYMKYRDEMPLERCKGDTLLWQPLKKDGD